MIVIACTDDSFGMMFNKRRVSQDKVLRAMLMQSLNGAPLWLNAYSAGQFEQDYQAHLRIDEAFPDKAGAGEYCFVENLDCVPYADRIERIILYRWNRAYPSDFKFVFPGGREVWQLSETEEFSGSSHDRITKECYMR